MKKKETPDKNKFDWDSYYKNRSNQIPRETVLKALELFEKEKNGNFFAIDLGCGHGADTLELLKRRWKVLAIDNDSNGLKLLNESAMPEWKKNLKTSKQAFEAIKLKECDLLNAGYSIPFCKPEYFEKLWIKIVNSVKEGGRFSGNLFGNRDEWAEIKTMTFNTKDEAKKLFKDFEVEFFEERDEDGFIASGEAKHWHVFSVVAKKKIN